MLNNASSLADESEDNSLSLSLPSEGSQKLTEVKAGILQIFDEAASSSDDKILQTFDNIIFEEKHEFEKTEKMKAKESTSASTTSELDFDSGYDRVESRSSSKVWNKIHKQLSRRFGGSTGSLSSTSPNSEAASKQVEASSKATEGIQTVKE